MEIQGKLNQNVKIIFEKSENYVEILNFTEIGIFKRIRILWECFSEIGIEIFIKTVYFCKNVREITGKNKNSGILRQRGFSREFLE